MTIVSKSVVVPCEPTEAMLDAANEISISCFEGDEECFVSNAEAWSIHRAMVAAARPVEGPGEVERLVEETGSSSVDDLRDMALVGKSLMEVIGIVIADGPYKDWTPADNPDEIVTDLINDLDETRERLEKVEAVLAHAVAMQPEDDSCELWVHEARAALSTQEDAS